MDINKSRLFMHLDILGFSNLAHDSTRTDRLFRILNNADLHKDSNFRSIVFSDTILVYNKYSSELTDLAKSKELMHLIELGKDLIIRLTGHDYFFRAIITEGEFVVNQMDNMQSYYGKALIDSHNDEKDLPGIGLFCDNKLRRLNHIFEHKVFSHKYDFVYTTQTATHLEYASTTMPTFNNADPFPLNPDAIESAGLQYLIYPEIVYLLDIYKNIAFHVDPKIRTKYLNTWWMYQLAYPQLTAVLSAPGFTLKNISDLDWSQAINQFSESMAFFAK